MKEIIKKAVLDKYEAYIDDEVYYTLLYSFCKRKKLTAKEAVKFQVHFLNYIFEATYLKRIGCSKKKFKYKKNVKIFLSHISDEVLSYEIYRCVHCDHFHFTTQKKSKNQLHFKLALKKQWTQKKDSRI